MLQKNEIIDLVIDGVTNEGCGVGRYDRMPIFVPGTCTGDRLRARIVRPLARCCYAIAEELTESSPDRTDPVCSVYAKCGGCSLRHLQYARELTIKNDWVRENFRRIGKIDLPFPPAIGSPSPDRYRNKAIYPVRMQGDALCIGFYAKRSHRVVEPTDCLLHPAFFQRIVDAFRRYLLEQKVSLYDETTHTGLVRALFLRDAQATGEGMVCIVVNGTALPAEAALVDAIRAAHPSVRSILLNRNCERTNVLLGRHCRTLWGADTITDRLCGLDFAISPLSFYQVNRAGAEQLYAVAADFAALTGTETLLDLYCGAGTIGLSMAHRVRTLLGVEVLPDAVRDAIGNAERNHISNARFLCADAADAALRLEREGLHPDVVILDPPRKGCTPDLIETIVRMTPDRVVMVSCDSATAARDAAAFAAHGYRPTRIQAVDLFPRTTHVECVTLFIKESNNLI